MHPIRPARALLSVSDKTGIEALARALVAQGVQLLSTGGTASLLAAAGIAVQEVATYTGFAEMMDGRVKTLHPMIHGGLLALRDHPDHLRAMQEHGIGPIDLLVVNLYPFEATLAKGASYAEAIEQIDIGGPAMVRSAAKNHAHVAVVVDPADYDELLNALDGEGIGFGLRQKLAAKAFARTASYDSAIARYLAGQEYADPWPPYLLDATRKQTLRYGENPHQSAAFYARPHAAFGLATATQLQGKELSYNNLNDTDAAWQLVCEFTMPAVAIIKHANPCGVALGKTLADAYHSALACDPQSAFGGIIALNQTLDVAFVEALGSLFAEVIIAPAIDAQAAALLAAKKNLRVLITGGLLQTQALDWRIKSVAGGYLVQSNDAIVLAAPPVVATKNQPTPEQTDDLHFAFIVCKHVKSNAIVLARGGATIGIGAGQMSRVDSVRLACSKAAAAGLDVAGSAMASDAFFPFDDNVHEAAKHGIAAIIQPGGSVRDGEVIAAADRHHMAMVMTAIRHFNH